MALRAADSVHRHPNDHLQLSCDAECLNAIVKYGMTEDELLDHAEELGWNIDRDFGLHYCPLTTMHDCAV